MLNPASDKFRIEISSHMFPKAITQKYDEFLKLRNNPIKLMEPYLLESIQSINIPGISLNTSVVNGLNNLNGADLKDFPHTTITRTFPGNASQNEIIDSQTLNITFRNTIFNWMYIFEVLFKYYKRKREIPEFNIMITMLDAAEIPMILFKFSDCFIATIPGLEFAFNQSFREAKTFDAGFVFNKFDVEFILPGFDIEKFNF